MDILTKKKTANRSAVFLGEGIFTMGLVKTIYNVLGGFYMDYNSTNHLKSVHKLTKSLKSFLCTFSPSICSISHPPKNMHKKNRDFTSRFCFHNFPQLQTMPQTLLWKSFLFPKEAPHSGLKHHDVP